MDKLQIEVNKGMAMVAEMVKMKAFSEASGKQQSWWSCKMNHNIKNGKECKFEESDLPCLNATLENLGSQLAEIQLVYTDNREEVVEQIRKLGTLVSMPYIYNNVMGKGRVWYKDRMRKSLANGRPYYFKEEDILQMNIAIIDIANRLKNIEFVL